MVSRLRRLLSRTPARWLVSAALALFVLAGAAVGADALWPPDPSRYVGRSAVVTDKDHRILRAFTTPDGKWRLAARAGDVDPRYLTLLRAFEDKRFDDHWGVDPIALTRAALQWLRAGRIVSGGSTLTMQVARLLAAPRPRGIATKFVQIARAIQLETRYRKSDIMAMYLTLAPFGGNLEGVARGVARLFRQGAGAAHAGSSGVAGGPAAIAGDGCGPIVIPPRRAPAATRCWRDFSPTASSRRGRRPRRAPSRCRTAACPSPLRRRIWRNIWWRWRRAARSTPGSTATCSAPPKPWHAARRIGSAMAPAWRRSWSKIRPATSSSISAAAISSAAARGSSTWRAARARRARRSSPSSTAWRSTTARCIRRA